MGTSKIKITSKDKLSIEEKKTIKKAAQKALVFDSDSPELTSEQLRLLSRQAQKKREQNKKPVIALRINPATLEKAKATGKGYTGFLSRLLDNAINDPEIVKKSL